MASSLATQRSDQTPLLQTVESRLSIRGADARSTQCEASSGPKHSLSSSSLCSLAGGKALGTCRICLDQESSDTQDPRNPLITPCQCTGSSKYVHRQCLQQWRETNHRSDAYFACEVCKYRYRYQRLWFANLLGSPGMLTIVFLLAMAACIALLGFVPITNAFFSSSSSSRTAGGSSGAGSGSSSSSGSSASGQVNPYALHFFNGVVVMSTMGLLLSLMIRAGRAFGLPALALLPDPWCPSCMWCLDVHGNGLSWGPVVECGGGAGECGVALLVLATIMMLMVGIVLACYMLWQLTWLLVQALLSRAQHMVENVQQDSSSMTGKEGRDSCKA